MPTQLLLEGRELGRRDPRSGRWLVRDASLRLESGECVVLSGPSGSGKTVLLRALCLLDGTQEGEVWWRGRRVANREVPAFRSRVCYVQQRAAFTESTAEASLRAPFSLRAHTNRSFDRARAVTLLERLGRDEDDLARQTEDLSGGERQIVALVRALLLEPDVLLLDEPTAALDPKTAEAAASILRRFVGEAADRRALLWVSHQPIDGSRRLVLDGGELREEGSR